MRASMEGTASALRASEPALAEIARAWTRIGFVGFGGPSSASADRPRTSHSCAICA